MKKDFLKVALFALASSVVLFSCKDDEDVIIDPNGGDVSVPLTTAQATALVNAVYPPLQTLSSSYSFFLESATETTICFEETVDDKDGPQVAVLGTKPDNWYAIKVFNRLYKSIAAANLAIDRIGEADVQAVTQKGLLIARAKFIRGYNYFQLVQLFGEVPLILDSSPDKASTTTRKSIEDVYAQVVKDLTEAIPDLPEYSAAKSTPSQLAAKTILAKAYLTWGQKPLTIEQINAGTATDPAKPEADIAKINQAIEYASAVINSGKYALQADFNQIWGVGNEDNQEVIFSVKHYGDAVDGQAGGQGNHQTHCGYTWPKDERADPHISYADISFENAIPDGDARKKYSYTTILKFRDTQNNIDTLTWPLSIVRPGKWIHRDGTGSDYALELQPNDIDHIDFRLAEVYLIRAEASLLIHDHATALTDLNKLRERAGATLLTASSTAALQAEWGYEFAFEQKHWLNLVRWRTFLSSIQKVKSYEYYKDQYSEANKANFGNIVLNGIPADPTRAAFYNRVNRQLRLKVSNAEAGGQKYYRFPIPLSENRTSLEINGQNPGY